MLTSRTQHIRADSIRHEVRRQDLQQHRGRGLAGSVGEPGRDAAIEAPDTAGGDHLTPTALAGVVVLGRVPGTEQAEKRYGSVEHSRAVHVEGIRELFHGDAEQRLLYLPNARSGGHAPRGPGDAGVGNKQIDISDIFFNERDRGSEGQLVGDIALDWDDIVSALAAVRNDACVGGWSLQD